MGTFSATTTASPEMAAPASLAPGIVELDSALIEAFAGPDLFTAILNAPGEVFRLHKHRRTFRVDVAGQRYFIKAHGASGWGEIVRNLFRLRLPVLTARPERLAIARLEALEIPTMRVAGYGCRGRNPARRESFLITEALENHLSLEDLAPVWNDCEPHQRDRLIRRAVDEVGRIARTLHTNGLNHRDFYLCHFLTRVRNWHEWSPADGMVFHVIDLHRMQIRGHTPLRWLIKDLSGLLFSVLDLELTTRDYLRFLRVYWGPDWKRRFRRSGLLRRIIVSRAVRLYRRKRGTPPRIGADLASSS